MEPKENETIVYVMHYWYFIYENWSNHSLDKGWATIFSVSKDGSPYFFPVFDAVEGLKKQIGPKCYPVSWGEISQVDYEEMNKKNKK